MQVKRMTHEAQLLQERFKIVLIELLADKPRTIIAVQYM